MIYEELYNELLETVKAYMEEIREVGFAWPENHQITKEPKTPKELAEVLKIIIDSSLELNQVLEESPASIYVADAEGTTIRVNKVFEEMTKTNRTRLFGKNVEELERNGIFRPSVCSITMKEKKRVAVLQQINDVNGIYVTGVPVFNRKGELFRTITNALLMEDINTLTSYVKEARNKQLADIQEIQNEDKFIAESSMMQEIIRLVDMVKNTETSVLITGETGVGKGVLARYIHNTGNRAGKRMMEINCGAIPDALLESELFGYESGAFTGADRKGKPGLIEMSEGGTLFLDEISELPLLLQVKLLHFLQNRVVTRVGGTKGVPINARVIAASNRDLKEQVQKGLFRSDLYYRLNVIPITIPPLRERPEDIRPAALYFFDKYMRKYGKSFDVNEGWLERLQQGQWPGNVRELENCIERIVVTNGMDSMENKELIPKAPQTYPHIKQYGQVYEQKDGQTLKEMEEELVVSAFQKYRSSYKVAEALGISQTAAYRKIKKYVK